jgi:hypothetical protein
VSLERSLSTLIDSIEAGKFTGHKPRKTALEKFEGESYIKSLRHYKNIRIKTRTVKCDVCGFIPPREFATILNTHHFIPFLQGGGNSLGNLMLVCPTCHAICHRIIRVSDKLLPDTRTAFIWFAKQVVADYEGLRKSLIRIFNDDDEELLVEQGDKILVDVERLFGLAMEYYRLYSST